LVDAVIAHGFGVFRREHDVLGAVAEHGAHYGLRAAHTGVDIGGVEQGDAEIDRLVDHLARGLQIGALAEIVAAETDGGNTQAGAAEITNLHGWILWEGARGASIVACVSQARKARLCTRWTARRLLLRYCLGYSWQAC